jgi:hypothetical protein
MGIISKGGGIFRLLNKPPGQRFWRIEILKD